jgi:competence protein ComEC
LGVFISFIHLPLGLVFRLPIGVLVSYIRLVTGGIGRFPLAALYIRSVYLPCWLALVWISMALYRFLPGLEHRFRSFLITTGASLVVFLGLSYWEPAMDELRFCALDVGQGQCLVLTGPSGVTVIDCGGSQYQNAGDLAAEYLYSQGRFRADVLVLTHFHQDHVNGTEQFLRRVPAACLYCPRPAEDDREALALLDFARERGTTVVYVEEDILWLEDSGLTMALVPPLNRQKENESGLCIAAETDDFSLLCTGDAGRGTEKRLLERMRLEALTILIAGHHGSAGSVSEELLNAVHPRAVVISVGRNSYGLPSEKTVTRIQNCGAEIRRTDINGDVILRVRQGEAQWVR